MKIILSAKARRQLHTLPASEGLKVGRKLLELDNNPFAGKPLTGKFKSFHSLRAWPYRIIYQVDKNNKVVTIRTIEHRQGVYK